jgi:hypothetical protein
MTQGRQFRSGAALPRHGTGEMLEKTVFYTKAGDQICGVGYYKE